MDSFNFSQIKEQYYYYRYFAADSHPVVARVAWVSRRLLKPNLLLFLP